MVVAVVLVVRREEWIEEETTAKGGVRGRKWVQILRLKKCKRCGERGKKAGVFLSICHTFS